MEAIEHEESRFTYATGKIDEIELLLDIVIELL